MTDKTIALEFVNGLPLVQLVDWVFRNEDPKRKGLTPKEVSIAAQQLGWEDSNPRTKMGKFLREARLFYEKVPGGKYRKKII